MFLETLDNGSELVLVAQPLADATSLSWPEISAEEITTIRHITSGRLTLAADLEQALAVAEGVTAPAPPVIAVVGAAPAGELVGLLNGFFAERVVATWSASETRVLVEGSVNRRLGAPGDEASVKLQVALPRVSDPDRAPVEVLWELLPEVLVGDFPGLRSRIEDDTGLIELRVDPLFADMKLRELRLAMAKIASDPRFKEDRVEAAARRLKVRRLAVLEDHPEASDMVAELWLDNGAEAVQQHLFGLDGVTLERVRQTAESWMPQHPGQATLGLPPRVFNPRFAAEPERLQLDNDLSAAVLERSGTALAALCVRPVLLADVDGEISATILARLAAEVRADEAAPGWIRVSENPPLLELAGSYDGFPELCEVLQRALASLSSDARPVGVQAGGDARRRALRLMAVSLGLNEGVALSPAELLRPGNLALGVVAPDGEAAAEALRKFGVGGSRSTGATESRPLLTEFRTREAAPGGDSVLAVALELAGDTSGAASAVLVELITERAREQLPGVMVEVLVPLVPGRRVIVLLAAAEMELEKLESRVSEGWGAMVSGVGEGELVELRRRVAAFTAGEVSGALGQARKCAAVAAGVGPWAVAAQSEMEILGLSPEVLNTALAGLESWEAVQTTGAGVLSMATIDP